MANHSVCDAALALWYTAPGQAEIRSEPLAALSADEVRVRATFGALSRGTESLVFGGRVPVAEYGRMGAPFMSGAFPFPVKYGYSTVGVVESGQDDLVGRNVFTLHPHQTCFNHPKAAVFPLPDEVPSSRAVLAANMETAVNIAWDAAPLAGERIIVIGAGVVGLLAAALLAKTPGATVTLCDIDPSRASHAARLGCRFALPPDAPAEQDLIVHASATEAGLRTALACAAFEGRIVEASWYGDKTPALPLGEAFHVRRLRLISTQVGSVATAMRGRRTHAQRLALALDLLADPAYDAMLEAPTPFDTLPETMPRLLAGGLCHVVTYGDP